MFLDCQDAFEQGERRNGNYALNPLSSVFYIAKCYFDTNQGWTVFSERFDGSADFNRDFSSYRNGFGDLDGEYWAGMYMRVIITKWFSVHLFNHNNHITAILDPQKTLERGFKVENVSTYKCKS